MTTPGIINLRLNKPSTESTDSSAKYESLSSAHSSSTANKTSKDSGLDRTNGGGGKSGGGSKPPPAGAVATKTMPFNYDKYKLYKRLAQTAQAERKIFSIIGGGYQPIRQALLQRGWQERLHDKQQLELQQTSHRTLLLKAQPGNQYEMAAIARLLRPFPAYFLWHPRGVRVTCFDELQPFKSRLTRAREFDFTLKEGLVNCAREGRWQYVEGRAELSCPRSYRLCIEGEADEFMHDFRFTGCTSLIGYLVAGVQPGGSNERFAGDGECGSQSSLSDARCALTNALTDHI